VWFGVAMHGVVVVTNLVSIRWWWWRIWSVGFGIWVVEVM
jgi:hypothetical protein